MSITSLNTNMLHHRSFFSITVSKLPQDVFSPCQEAVAQTEVSGPQWLPRGHPAQQPQLGCRVHQGCRPRLPSRVFGLFLSSQLHGFIVTWYFLSKPHEQGSSSSPHWTVWKISVLHQNKPDLGLFRKEVRLQEVNTQCSNCNVSFNRAVPNTCHVSWED